MLIGHSNCLLAQAPAQAPAPVLAQAFAPAPGLAQRSLCPGGSLPTAWNCTHLDQPFEFDLASYNEAAPLAKREKWVPVLKIRE